MRVERRNEKAEIMNVDDYMCTIWALLSALLS